MKTILLTTSPCFIQQLTIRSSDQRGFNERSDDCAVLIDVIRDNQAPFCTNEPYGVSISENRFNETIYTDVNAFDNDLQVLVTILFFQDLV